MYFMYKIVQKYAVLFYDYCLNQASYTVPVSTGEVILCAYNAYFF